MGMGGVNSKADQDPASVSKYHQEKMEPNPSGAAVDSKNPQVVANSGKPHGLVYPNSENPMMHMSGGKAPAGGNGELDSKNAMMPMSGSNPGSEVPSQGEVMSTNPQGHKQAPLAGKLLKYR